MHTVLAVGLPTTILLAGLIDDLRSGKVHNWLILSLGLVTILTVGIFMQFSGINQGLLGSGMAIVLCIPLFKGGILGGGDLKLLTVFGLSTDWNTVLWVLVYSFFWGALLGFIRAVLSGNAIQLLKNTIKLALPKTKREDLQLQRIPYTVALAFGWLTQLSLVWS